VERRGLTVIELSEIGDSNSGSHSKFSGSPEVVQIIGAGPDSAGRFGETSSLALDDILAGSPIRVLGN
jgi:esterase/lipase superfamily enzyme